MHPLHSVILTRDPLAAACFVLCWLACVSVLQSMVALNKATNMPELQKIMMEFSKQSEQMEMKQEMIGEALEDVSAGRNTRAAAQRPNPLWHDSARAVMLMPAVHFSRALSLLPLCRPWTTRKTKKKAT